MKSLSRHTKWLPLTSILLLSMTACVSQKAVKPVSEGGRDSVSKNITAKSVKSTYWIEHPKVISWRDDVDTKQRQQLFNWMVGELTAYKGNIKTGLMQLTTLAYELNQADAYRRVANIAFYAKDNKAAYDMVDQWLQLEPDNEQAHRMALNLEIDRLTLSLPKAEENIHQHIDWLLKNSDAPLKQRFLDVTAQLGQQKNQTVALSLMDRVIEQYPGNADAYAAYANLAVIVKEPDIASTALKKALSLNPKQSNAIILQSQIRHRKGDAKGALAQLDKAVRNDKQNRSLRNSYARMLMNDKQYKKARYQYEYLLEDTPNDASLLFTLGILALDNEDYKHAKQYFTRLQLVSNRQDEAGFYLGRIAEVEEKYKEAISYYLSVYGGNYYIESRFRAAWSYASLKQYDVAQNLLINLREQRDSAIILRSYIGEGQLLRNQKRYQEAFDLYTNAMQQYKQNDDLLYARSLVAEKLNRVDIVEQDLRDILKRKPDDADVLNALGYSLLNLTDRYDEALELIRRALQMQPESGPIIDSYGWALYRKGQYKEALVYLQKAYDLIPDPEIAAHLGEVLWVLGDRESAERIWNEALKAVPDSEIVLSTINRLKNQ